MTGFHLSMDRVAMAIVVCVILAIGWKIHEFVF